MSALPELPDDTLPTPHTRMAPAFGGYTTAFQQGERSPRVLAPGAEYDAAALYLNDLRATPMRFCTPEEEITLARRAQAGDTKDARAARNELWTRNLPLVVDIARRAAAATSHLKFEDFVQEGNLGLERAIAGYDSHSGWRFSTYATIWIRQAVGRALELKEHTIREPVFIQSARRKLDRTHRELTDALGRAPTDAEVAQALGISVTALARAREESRPEVLSLDWTLLPEEDSLTIGETIEDADAEEAFDPRMIRDEGHANIVRWMRAAGLSPRDRYVVTRALGLDGGVCLTLEAMSASLSEAGYGAPITRQRVQQILVRSLRWLKEAIEEERDAEAG